MRYYVSHIWELLLKAIPPRPQSCVIDWVKNEKQQPSPNKNVLQKPFYHHRPRCSIWQFRAFSRKKKALTCSKWCPFEMSRVFWSVLLHSTNRKTVTSWITMRLFWTIWVRVVCAHGWKPSRHGIWMGPVFRFWAHTTHSCLRLAHLFETCARGRSLSLRLRNRVGFLSLLPNPNHYKFWAQVFLSPSPWFCPEWPGSKTTFHCQTRTLCRLVLLFCISSSTAHLCCGRSLRLSTTPCWHSACCTLHSAKVKKVKTRYWKVLKR